MKNVQIILRITQVSCEIYTIVCTLKAYLFARIYPRYASFFTIPYYFLLVISTLLILTDTLVLVNLNL